MEAIVTGPKLPITSNDGFSRYGMSQKIEHGSPPKARIKYVLQKPSHEWILLMKCKGNVVQGFSTQAIRRAVLEYHVYETKQSFIWGNSSSHNPIFLIGTVEYSENVDASSSALSLSL